VQSSPGLSLTRGHWKHNFGTIIQRSCRGRGALKCRVRGVFRCPDALLPQLVFRPLNGTFFVEYEDSAFQHFSAGILACRLITQKSGFEPFLKGRKGKRGIFGFYCCWTKCFANHSQIEEWDLSAKLPLKRLNWAPWGRLAGPII
jgi:hypothetical protein